jgi:Methane oxygenase PmoA
MSLTRRVFLAMSGAAAVQKLSAQRKAFTLETGPAGKILKDPAGRVVLEYLTSKPKDVPLESNHACCVHPFNTPAGEPATDIAPSDHRTHRGIFLAWHDMEFTRGQETLRADFWGWGKFAPTDGRVIVNREVKLVRADEQTAEIAISNDWTIAGQTVLQESTTLGAGQEQDTRVLDLTYRLTPAGDYAATINRVAFSGFCCRCRKDGKYWFEDSKGEVTLPDSSATSPESDWPARSWYSHTVELGAGKTVSSAVIDHPRNPPSVWHGARSVSFLQPCIAANAPVKIAAGQPLTLRYRAAARDGKFPAGLLDRMAAEWRAKAEG